MQLTRPHIINKNTFIIKVDDTGAAKTINAQAAQVLQNLPGVFEEIFDACDNGDNITISKLEVELKFSGLDDFNQNFISKFKLKITEALAGQLGYGITADGLPVAPAPHTSEQGKIAENNTGPVGQKEDPQSPLPNKNMHRSTTWDTFEYYLENGVFPWWFAGTGGSFLQTLYDAWPRGTQVYLGDKITLLLKNPQKFQRFIQLIPENKLKQWAQLIAGNDAKNLYKTVLWVMDTVQKSHPVQLHYAYGWVYYTAFVSGQKHIAPLPENIVIMLKHWLEKMPNPAMLGLGVVHILNEYVHSLPVINLRKNSKVNIIIDALVKKIVIIALEEESKSRTVQGKKATKKGLKTIGKNSKAENEGIDENNFVAPKNKLKITGGTNTNKPQKTPDDAPPLPQKITAPDAQGVMISNAGLILCWPLLGNAFTKLGWLNEGKFKDIYSQKQAVLFLHYLVYKNLPEDESPLYLNKILCGMDTAEFISIKENIGEKWEEMRQKLWEAVLAAWEPLKSTSIEGLIGSFVLREGKVKPSAAFRNGFEIIVERKTIDILVDRLPWPISMIKPTWNSYMISVIW